MAEPTARQIECLEAYITHGTVKAAADSMGIAEFTLRNMLHLMRERMEMTTQQLIVWWARRQP